MEISPSACSGRLFDRLRPRCLGTITHAAAAVLIVSVTVTVSEGQEPVKAPKFNPLPGEGPPLAESLLLKDFRPRSIFKTPQTKIAKPKFPVIDLHAHPMVVKQNEIDQWVRTMDDCGVQESVVMVAAAGSRFDEMVGVFAKHPTRFRLWCGIDLDDVESRDYSERAVAELERCHALGATGVGELVDKGAGLFSFGKTTRPSGVHVDDDRLDPVFEKCAELNMPVNIHVAEPMWMYEPMDTENDMLISASKWRLHGRPDIIGHAQLIATLDRAVAKHPRTTFIACHYANCTHDLRILGKLLDKHDNLYADTGARFVQVSSIPRFAAQFFEKYQDRLLFGTDFRPRPEMYRACYRMLESKDEHFYEESFRRVQWPLYGLGLGDDVVKKVYRDNALRIFGWGDSNP